MKTIETQATETEMTDAEWNAVKRAILLPKWKQPTASDVAALRARVEARLAKN